MSNGKSVKDDKINAIIGKKIKSLRTKQGKTLKECGEVLGVTYSTYHGYEKGTRELGGYRISIILNYFGKSIDEFFKEVIDEANNEN